MDSNYEITLSFDYFNLSRSSDCSDDYVEVRDGPFDTSELLGKFCGADIPESITSDSWDMSLTFKSSGKTKYPGFKASYQTKKDDKSKFVMVKVTLVLLASFFLLNSNLSDEVQTNGTHRSHAIPKPMKDRGWVRVLVIPLLLARLGQPVAFSRLSFIGTSAQGTPSGLRQVSPHLRCLLNRGWFGFVNN